VAPIADRFPGYHTWLRRALGVVSLSGGIGLKRGGLSFRGDTIMVKILILTGDAGEAQEIYYAKFRLEEEGWQVQIATIERRVFHSVVHDFEPGFDTYTEKPGYRVQADLGLDEVVVKEYHGLVLPGGRAPEYLRNRPQAVSIVRHFLETGKPIAANCHGPLLLFAAGNMKERTMTCYPDLEPDVLSAGAVFVNREVVVDGSLVTVRGWPDNGPWMREFVRLLKTKQ
jgi:protease I